MKKSIMLLSTILLLTSCNNNIEISNYSYSIDESNNYYSTSEVPNDPICDYLHFNLLENGSYEVKGFAKNFYGNELHIPIWYNNRPVTAISGEFFSYDFPNKITVYIPKEIEYINSRNYYLRYNLIFEDPTTIKYNGFIEDYIDLNTFNELGLLKDYFHSNINRYSIDFDDELLSFYDNGVYLRSYDNDYKCLLYYQAQPGGAKSIKLHPNVEYISPYFLSMYDIRFDTSESAYFKTVNNNLYSKDGKDLIYFNSELNTTIDLTNVERILDNAFYGATIKEIIISNSLKTISADAFKLSEIYKITLIDNDYFKLKNGSLYSHDYKTLYKYVNSNSLYFNDNIVEYISNNALTYSNIESFKAENCKYIGDNAFTWSNVKEVDASSVTDFGKAVFSNSCIENIKFNPSLSIITSKMFYDCDNLKETFNIPSSVKIIEDYAFGFCQFDYLIIPEGVEIIEPGALPANLQYLKLPKSLKYLTSGNLNQLQMVTFKLPENLELIYPSTFYLTKCDNIIINDKIAYLPSSCFANSYIKDIYIPSSISSIGNLFNSEDFERFGSYNTMHFESDNLPEDLDKNWNSLNCKYILEDSFFRQ